MVMVSIVLGLGVTQALRGFSKIARSSSTFLPLTIWATTLFYLHIQVWWALWDLTAVGTWNQRNLSRHLAGRPSLVSPPARTQSIGDKHLALWTVSQVPVLFDVQT